MNNSIKMQINILIYSFLVFHIVLFHCKIFGFQDNILAYSLST